MSAEVAQVIVTELVVALLLVVFVLVMPWSENRHKKK